MYTFDTEGIMPTSVKEALRSAGYWYIGHAINEVHIRGARSKLRSDNHIVALTNFQGTSTIALVF